MSKGCNLIDDFAKNPRMTPLLDVAGEWHDLHQAGEFDQAGLMLALLRSKAIELLGPDSVDQTHAWVTSALSVSGLARASIEYGEING